MAFNTRCPACTTVFSVPPSALSASGGWVRCGRCSEVFDASAHQDDGLNTEFNEVADRLARQMQIPLSSDAQADVDLRPRRDGKGQAWAPTRGSMPSTVSNEVVPPRELTDPSAKKAARVGRSLPQSSASSLSSSRPMAVPIAKTPSRDADGRRGAENPMRRTSVERRRKSESDTPGAEPTPSQSRLPLKSGGDSFFQKSVFQESSSSGETKRVRSSRLRNRSDRSSVLPDNSPSLQSALPLEDVSTPSVQQPKSSNSGFGGIPSQAYASAPSAPTVPPPNLVADGGRGGGAIAIVVGAGALDAAQ